MIYIEIYLIKFWQKIIYPIIKPIFPSSCRFTPSCSTYTIQSVEKYGVIKGSFLGFKRILRCNPFSDTSD